MNRKKPTQFTSNSPYPDPFNMVRQPYQPKPRKNYAPIIVRFVLILALLFVAAYLTDFLGVQQKVNSVQPGLASMMAKLKAWTPVSPETDKQPSDKGEGLLTPDSIEPGTPAPALIGTQISLLDPGQAIDQNPIIPTDYKDVTTPQAATPAPRSESGGAESGEKSFPTAAISMETVAADIPIDIQPVILGSSVLTPMAANDDSVVIPQGNLPVPTPVPQDTPVGVSPSGATSDSMSSSEPTGGVEGQPNPVNEATNLPSVDITSQSSTSSSTTETNTASTNNTSADSTSTITDIVNNQITNNTVTNITNTTNNTTNSTTTDLTINSTTNNSTSNSEINNSTTNSTSSSETNNSTTNSTSSSESNNSSTSTTNTSNTETNNSTAGTTTSPSSVHTSENPVTITFAPAINLPRTTPDPNIIGVWVIPLNSQPGSLSPAESSGAMTTTLETAAPTKPNEPVSEVGVIIAPAQTGNEPSGVSPATPSDAIASIAEGTQNPAGPAPSTTAQSSNTSSEVGVITVVEEADGTLSENENPQSSESQSNETATSVATEPVPAISESATTVEISSNTGGYGSPVARPLSNRISELAAANSINLNKPLDQIVLQTAIPITIKPTQSGQIVIPTDGPSPTATLPPVVQPTTKPVSTSAAVNPTKVQLPAAKTPTPGTQLDGGAVLLPTSVPLTTQAMTYLPTSSLTITATRLPKTGFADEVGLPLLALGALILLALLFLIRQLQIKSLQ